MLTIPSFRKENSWSNLVFWGTKTSATVLICSLLFSAHPALSQSQGDSLDDDGAWTELSTDSSAEADARSDRGDSIDAPDQPTPGKPVLRGTVPEAQQGSIDNVSGEESHKQQTSSGTAAAPDNHFYAVSMYNLGLDAYNKQSPESAIVFFERATKLDPTLVDARYNLGILYLSKHRYAEALFQLEAASKLSPSDSAVRQQIEKCQKLMQKSRL